MFVADVDVRDAGLEKPGQRLRVIGVGGHANLPLDDARFQVRPAKERNDVCGPVNL
jgi:hypothetical protein